MINGEGPRRNTSRTTSPDPFHEFSPRVYEKPQVTNASPDSSDYSSCGESEFERYCSANSVMGTPSLCSSVGTFNDFLDLDFGSVKSSGVGQDRLRLARNLGDMSVSTSGGFDYLIDGGLEFHGEDANGLDSPQSSNIRASTSTGIYDDNNSEFLRVRRGSGGSLPAFAENHNSQVVSAKNNEEQSPIGTIGCEGNFSEKVDNSFDPFDVRGGGSPEEEDNSSRYELSDDDSSMFNYDTDDEHKTDSYNTRNLRYLQDSKSANKNPLLVGSAVAFGSDDWDDFMQETGNSLVSLSLNKPKDTRQENLETKGLNSISMVPVAASNIGKSEQAGIVRNVPSTTCLDNGKEDPESYSTIDSLVQQNNFLAEKASLKIGLNNKDSAAERVLRCISNKDVIGPDIGDASENVFFEKSKQSGVSDMTAVHLSASAITESCGKKAIHFEDHGVEELPPPIENDFNVRVKAITEFSPASVNRSEEHLAPIKVGNFEAKESYDEVVLEMEEILLDSTETPGARFPQRSPQPLRDGSSTASTSGTDDVHPLVQHPLKIDGVEVVGAKQKKGDVSLGERLVGVKEYTVYLLRVWSGNDQWEVERRYRDFFTLYRQLKTLYANHGWSLPTPWSRVEQESRKFFGNASPNVVSERSTLIQECLRSILHSGTPNSAPGTLNWFLSPQKAISSSSLLSTFVIQSTSAFMGGTSTEDAPTFGKTISLLVEIQPRKSVKQLLEAQHYVCAGCHKRLDTEKSLMREFVHTLSWGKPRPCEYTGQLFCASCHTNETAVLPAKVLHFWDFTKYPVSQMAKSYLDSIYEQPMLCVSAVNPFLFSKVPALFHVVGIRRKIGAMMPYVRCPFRRSIQRGVGSRRYLLESNEFFALRDLVDLSKGAFSALPVMVETVSTKILDHITQQCLICCDVGIPCGARQACEDPSSLIFPFQEDEVKRCGSCKSVFHKPCFRKFSNCPCIASSLVHKTAAGGSEVGKSAGPAPDVNNKSSNEALDTLAKKPDSGSPVRFLSHLFSNKKQELARKNSNPVILMGSLPSTFSDPL